MQLKMLQMYRGLLPETRGELGAHDAPIRIAVHAFAGVVHEDQLHTCMHPYHTRITNITITLHYMTLHTRHV